jgi:hypothetical protein
MVMFGADRSHVSCLVSRVGLRLRLRLQLTSDMAERSSHSIRTNYVVGSFAKR